ncbi:MAG TPA: ABC transporter substrate-binding protein [Ilumatobacter sp.]|jgi:peptide/nickel transport system substrate-binding protein|nr:ABC transporter substrate-binding protein [Ilumatobacter sp.]
MSRMIWVAALAAVTIGCKSESSSSSRSSGGSAATAPKVGDGPQPQVGGNVRLPSTQPAYLNPILQTRYDLANTILYEGLVTIDAKGDAVGRLAKSFEVSPDGLTITFKLRDNAVWHDGQKITSEDVAFTFDTVRKYAGPTLWKGYMAPVVRIQTPDDTTVVVSYAQPYAPALATWTMPIVAAHIFRGEDDLADAKGNREAVGSGPFKLVRWEQDRRIVLAANDKWWGGKPLLASIELVLNVEDGAMLGQLRRGQLDWAPIRLIDDQAELSQSPDLLEQFEHQDAFEQRIRLIAWNTDHAPFDDKRVRQALTMALDRSRVIDDVLHGQAQIVSAPLLPNTIVSDASIAPLPFDLARADKLLSEVVKAKGPPGAQRLVIKMVAAESQRSPITDATFQIFRRDLQTLGVDLQLTILSGKDYEAAMVKRDFDAVYFGWLPDTPDPDPYTLLHSTEITGANYAGFTNDEVDKLLDNARTTTDPKARKALYAKIHAIVVDEMPYTALYVPYGHYAWTRRLHNVGVRDLGVTPAVPGIARWWVSSTLPTPGE